VYFSSSAGAQRYFTPGQNDAVNGGQKIKVFDHGVPLDFDEELAEKILSEEAVEILVTMEDGAAEGRAWGCDLTYDYVKINGDYRT
jgi:glutamate N-acetyltransferase/amino-acid N-acetyltransferase